jgi:hypothetical protein
VTFRLPRLPGDIPSSLRVIWGRLQYYWQRLCEAIEAQEARQDETINRIRRLLSHTEPTSIIEAVDDGATCTVTLLPHTRVYADATTLAITGASESGLLSNTWYAAYYDDPTMADTSPDIIFTTDLEIAQAARADGRHFCGQFLTPEAGSGDTIESGGSYPGGGGTVGGEIGDPVTGIDP